MLPAQSVVASTMRWTALRIPAIRRLHEDRGQLACSLAEAQEVVGALQGMVAELQAAIGDLQEAHGASVARLSAVHAEQVAQLIAINATQAAQLAALTAQATELTAQLSRTTLDRPLAFMHVPKSSGLALAYGIREVLPSTPVVSQFDLSTFGGFRAFDTMSPELRAMIHVDGLPPSASADFVSGHFAYSTLVGGRPDARLMTVLREPHARLLSLWMFLRSGTDETLRAWGAWAALAALARRPLVEFLACPQIASHTDNVAVRLLLWPHALIPDEDFIPETADERLAEEAMARLQTFAFADIFENPQLAQNVRTFLARPFVYQRMNETQVPPPELSVAIDAELSDAAMRLLSHRSRLDRRLWLALSAARMPHVSADSLARDALADTVARFRALQPG